MSDSVRSISFPDSVRLRPGMYLGSRDSKGVINLFHGFFNSVATLFAPEEFFFSLSILHDSKFEIAISASRNIDSLLHKILSDQPAYDLLYLPLLRYLTGGLSIVSGPDHWHFKDGIITKASADHIAPTQKVLFTFDIIANVFTGIDFDYYKLNEQFYQAAMLNRHAEILLVDSRQKHLSQSYLYYPQGILHIYERKLSDEFGKPIFELKYDEQIGENKYQIVIAYGSFYNTPSVVSFADENLTTYGGSLVDGIIDGIHHAIKNYINSHNLYGYNVRKIKIRKNILAVAAVSGPNLRYAGATRHKLDNKEIQSEVKKIISGMVTQRLNENEEIAKSVLRRFEVFPQ